jgi:hypothetical protein
MFPTIPLPLEKVTKGDTLKAKRSMPFFSTEACPTTSELLVASTSSRSSPTARRIRKNSKVAQMLGIIGTREPARDGANVVDPLGAALIGNGFPASQMKASCSATQSAHRPTLSTSSLPMRAEWQRNYTHSRYVSTSQSRLTGSTPATTDKRTPRSQLRTDHMNAGTLSARSRSNPPPPVTGDHTTSRSQPRLNPSQSVYFRSARQHRLTSTHARYTEDAFAPSVRGATVTGNSAPKQAPHLRKASSNAILSTTPSPFHMPTPRNLSQKPSAETVLTLEELASRNPSHSNIHSTVGSANVVPAQVVPPMRIVMPPQVEQDAYRTAAHEAERMRRAIGDERALIEGIRSGHGREVRAKRDAGRERERHHRRAATESPRRRGREVEYRSLADYGYFDVGQP